MYAVYTTERDDDIVITATRGEGQRETISFILFLFFLNFEFDWFTFIASLNPAAAATTGEELRSDLSRQKATRERERELYSIADLHFVFTRRDSIGQWC